MKLRPHHLLCTQGYSGKGYSETFVENMNMVVARLRRDEPVEIQLVFSTDDICKACPHHLDEDLCVTNEKVKTYDQKFVDYFGLEKKTYIYQQLIQDINRQLTEEKLADICEGCSWYPISACRNNILETK